MRARLIEWSSALGVVIPLLAVACDGNAGVPTSAPTASVSSAALTPSAVPSSSDERAFLSRGVVAANYHILKLNFAHAEELLKNEVGPYAAMSRARLALYRADCEEARAHLSSSLVQNEKAAQDLIGLAKSCYGATAGSVVIDDQERGIWVRLQDQSDRVLVQMIADVAHRARETLERDLGETLPRPLRIDLVRDLFSLSAVSGLPVDAAETTGTVAVARWGRITMVSPRAIANGFPWADTLAHEITHLLISRATIERAPLWLQEGVAKRQERRWRAPQLFDDTFDPDQRAFAAQREGRSVGVNKIGPSIAMLPSADAAGVAFAEVASFIEYWIERNGPHALPLLLRELEVAPHADSALMSVSGFNVEDWEVQWRAELARRFAQVPAEDESEVGQAWGPRALGRSLRLIELLSVDGQPALAQWQGTVDLDRAPHVAALRFLTARAGMLKPEGNGTTHLGHPADVQDAHAGWLALYAADRAGEAGATGILDQARALDPLLPEVACGGTPWVGLDTTWELNEDSPLPVDQDLCEAARKLPVRGSADAASTDQKWSTEIHSNLGHLGHSRFDRVFGD